MDVGMMSLIVKGGIPPKIFRLDFHLLGDMVALTTD